MTNLSLCQNDPPKNTSYWQNPLILFELCLLWYLAQSQILVISLYSNFSGNYCFVPVGVKTNGTYGPQGIKLVDRLAEKYKKLWVKNCLHFISYKVSQWQCNEVKLFAFMGCPKSTSRGLERLFNFHVQNAEMLW